MTVRFEPKADYETSVPLIVIGAGAAGLSAALAASEAGIEAIVLERDPVPAGSTALSAGLIPAAGTRFQRAHAVFDTASLFAADIDAKSHGEADQRLVTLVSKEAGSTVEWLADAHGLPFSLVHDFDYPGHSVRRMHGLPSRSGAELIDRLRSAVEAAGISILCEARVTTLFADEDRRVHGVELVRPDSSVERIGCDALILASNGYGGNTALIAEHIPEMSDALYFGHPGNQGDAVLWGAALRARLSHLSGYQGHGSVAHPHGILISWASMSEGGFQVNAQGSRFSDESRGYSEQARDVLAQPGAIAWSIFDKRIAAIMRQFADFQVAEAQGAVLSAPDMEVLAAMAKLPAEPLLATVRAIDQNRRSGTLDAFGRNFAAVSVLEPPFKAVRVTGALFHTQGGLAIDPAARVMRQDGATLPNLFAAGGAAVGVSGGRASGYLSGNGLLSAVVLGRVAGIAAARLLEAASEKLRSHGG